MAVKNSLVQQKQKPKFSVVIQQDAYKQLINNTLGNPKKAEKFVAAVSSAVAVNPALQECEAATILSAALLGETLNLSPSPQLGHYYMVPFKKKDREGNVVAVNAQFVLGWKGYIQLATRSGYYKKINVLAVKEGELVRFNPLEEEIEVNLIEDEEERENAKTIGYYAMFEYLNGFRKAIYWSKPKMEMHADKYSQAFSLASYKLLLEGKVPQKDLWKYSSFWYKDFDDMAFKTMLRQLISKWGIVSIDMQKAFEADIETEQKETSFVDNESPVDDFFGDDKPTEDKDPEKNKKDKDNAVDVPEEEINEIFGQADFFEEEQ